MRHILTFHDDGAADHALVGGKGANLGVLTRAGFPVPAGFTVTTAAYQDFLDGTGLAAKIATIVETIDFDDADGVETAAGEIRALVDGADMPPEVADAVTFAYGRLGEGVRVAVRSSGTAEDLEGASFAGQHDTYLHIRGTAEVIDAVKRCWASLWTARATSYRQHKGFGQEQIGIAVVVQQMVDAEVSGVMFTANPISAITDEIGINASWGLGEAIVSGMVTPDLYTVDLRTLRINEKVLGTKELRIRLDNAAGQGTVTEQVPPAQRDAFALSDTAVAELSALGCKVMHHYDDMPQDIEWAMVDGSFYLLQARPVTGANFSWDEAIGEPDDHATTEDTVWSRVMSDDGWTGAVSPLFFSHRGQAFEVSSEFTHGLYGWDDVARLQYVRYYRGTVYWNTKVDKAFVERMGPPSMRPSMLNHVSPLDHEDVLKAPFSYLNAARVLARVHALAPAHGITSWVKRQQDYIDNRRVEAAGKSDDELRLLSDDALIDYIESRITFENKYVEDIYTGYLLHWVMAGQLLARLVTEWYDGDSPGALIDLLTGTEKQTFTVRENLALWELTQIIRESPALLDVFRAHPGAGFFARLDGLDDGQAFLAKYAPFLETYGHRGHADRDSYFIRRAEDPGVTYRSLDALLKLDADFDPSSIEHAAIQRKQAAHDDIVANLQKKPLGGLRVEAFKALNAYNQRLLIGRDDERSFVDICTFTIKRGFKELNRRAMERGLFEGDLDFFFLGRRELYEVFRGRANMKLTKAKIAGRKHNFDRVNKKEMKNPTYLHFNKPMEPVTDDGDGITLKGLPTSGGVVTATARIVKSLEEIGLVQKGEIMVCNSTDPGWTPVFLLLAGAVFETGGAFAHCSCLSREYGIPAVQVLGALDRIPDGATITLDGNTGVVTIVDADELVSIP